MTDIKDDPKESVMLFTMASAFVFIGLTMLFAILFYSVNLLGVS